MRYKIRIAVLGIFILALTLSATAEVEEEDFELVFDQEKYEIGEILESRVDLPEDVEENYRFIFRIDGQSYRTGDPYFQHRVTGEEERLRVRVMDADADTVTGLSEDINVTGEEVVDEPEPEPVFDPDVEGFEVDYHDSGAEITVSGEELRERPGVLLGESISAWHEVTVQPARDTRDRGGVVVELEEETDYDLPDDLVVYSVVEVSGENLDVIELYIDADVSSAWVSSNDLFITRRHADVSFYRIEGGDWNRIDSDIRRGSKEHLDLRTDREADTSVEDGEMIAIAGDPEGLEHGRFAAGPDGSCEELEEDDPIPPGWEEIPVSCDIHQEKERSEDRILDELDRLERRTDLSEDEVQEMRVDVQNHLEDYEVAEARNIVESYEIQRNLGEMEERIEQMERAGIEGSEDISSQKSEVEYLLNQGETGAAERELSQLNDQMHQHQEEMQEIMQYYRQIERIESKYAETDDRTVRMMDTRMERQIQRDGLPEELEDELTYERSEEVQDLFDQAYEEAGQVAEGEITEAEFQNTLEELRETKEGQEDLQRIKMAEDTYQNIERLRDRDELEEEHVQQIDEAERLLLEEHEVEEAHAVVEEVGEDIQMARARDFIQELLQDEEIRSMIREIVADVMPGL